MIKKRKNKIIVAMSGGVDSSVAAALLKKTHFDVVGVFMKFWSASDKSGLSRTWNRRCSPEAEKRARKVAQILNIPFYVLNFEKEFKKRVVDYFIKEIKEGKTPNPCVVCNKEIKFGLLLEKALALGANFVATGHYVRTNLTSKFFKSHAIASKIKKVKLLRGKDKKKDQSYFLWHLTQEQLRHILFPIGDYTKTQVKNLAKKFKLPVLEINESQEICFIKDGIDDFLLRHLKLKPGKIIDKQGNILGEHQGLHFYTLGQRKGIGLAGGPWYVLEKDSKRNILIVTKDERDLEKQELIAAEVNWISGEVPELPLEIKAKVRYKSPLSSAIIKKSSGGCYKVIFKKPQRAITPGQSVVFYKGEEVLGGGIIRS